MRVPASLTLGLAALLWTTQAAEAQHVSLDIRDGTVTLDARGATVPQILREWTRVGGVRVINAEKIGGTPVTLLLRDVTERQALDILLRDAAGYLLFARRDGIPGISAFEQILVVPVNKAAQALPPAAGGRADLAPFRPGTMAGVPRLALPPQAAPGGDQSEVEASADADDAQDAPDDDLAGAEPNATAAAPPTPSLPPPPPPPDPGNPFGSAGATARPGVATPPPGPPPGVVYPPVTNPNLPQQGAPAPILR